MLGSISLGCRTSGLKEWGSISLGYRTSGLKECWSLSLWAVEQAVWKNAGVYLSGLRNKWSERVLGSIFFLLFTPVAQVVWRSAMHGLSPWAVGQMVSGEYMLGSIFLGYRTNIALRVSTAGSSPWAVGQMVLMCTGVYLFRQGHNHCPLSQLTSTWESMWNTPSEKFWSQNNLKRTGLLKTGFVQQVEEIKKQTNWKSKILIWNAPLPIFSFSSSSLYSSSIP